MMDQPENRLSATVQKMMVRCTAISLHNIAMPRRFAFISIRRFDFALKILTMQLPENRLSATLQKMMVHYTTIALQNIALPRIFAFINIRRNYIASQILTMD